MVNKTILDYEKYKQNIVWEKERLMTTLKELFAASSYENTVFSQNSYHHSKLEFYNQELDLEVMVLIRKSKRELFV